MEEETKNQNPDSASRWKWKEWYLWRYYIKLFFVCVCVCDWISQQLTHSWGRSSNWMLPSSTAAELRVDGISRRRTGFSDRRSIRPPPGCGQKSMKRVCVALLRPKCWQSCSYWARVFCTICIHPTQPPCSSVVSGFVCVCVGGGGGVGGGGSL